MNIYVPILVIENCAQCILKIFSNNPTYCFAYIHFLKVKLEFVDVFFTLDLEALSIFIYFPLIHLCLNSV